MNACIIISTDDRYDIGRRAEGFERETWDSLIAKKAGTFNRCEDWEISRLFGNYYPVIITTDFQMKQCSGGDDAVLTEALVIVVSEGVEPEIFQKLILQQMGLSKKVYCAFHRHGPIILRASVPVFDGPVATAEYSHLLEKGCLWDIFGRFLFSCAEKNQPGATDLFNQMIAMIEQESAGTSEEVTPRRE